MPALFDALARAVRTLIPCVALLLLAAAPAFAQTIPTPEEHFGFTMGTDKELARWDDILDYFTIVADASDRIVVDTAGSTTLGNPFVSITITSPSFWVCRRPGAERSRCQSGVIPSSASA